MGSCNEPPRFFCFFLFYHYSCATYLDHDEGTIRFLAADCAATARTVDRKRIVYNLGSI